MLIERVERTSFEYIGLQVICAECGSHGCRVSVEEKVDPLDDMVAPGERAFATQPHTLTKER